MTALSFAIEYSRLYPQSCSPYSRTPEYKIQGQGYPRYNVSFKDPLYEFAERRA